MSTLDPNTIDVTQPSSNNPTTSGMRGVIAAIKALFVLAKAEIAALEGRVTAIESGSGVGSTLTEATAASLGVGQSLVVTHPAVPLSGEGAGAIWFAALGLVSGSSGSAAPSGTSGWISQDLNVNGASWVKDSGSLGHFTVDPGPDVGLDCRVHGDLYAHIVAYGEDPTAASSVQLSEELASGPVSEIVSLYGEDGWVKQTGYSGYPSNGFHYCLSLEILSDASAIGMLTGFGGQIATGGANGRAAVSLDSGGHWLAFDGSSWAEIDLEELATAGMVLPTDLGETWHDSLDVALPLQAWASLLELMQAEPALSVRWACGFDQTGVYNNVYSLQAQWSEVSTIRPLALFRGSGVGFLIKRLSATRTAFQYSGPGYGLETYSDFRCQVRTGG